MLMPQAVSQSQTFAEGVLPSQTLEAFISEGVISSQVPVEEGQIQPASLDLRLADVAYRVRAGFLPSRSTVEAYTEDLKMHTVSLADGGVLEAGAVYIIPLQESLNLPEGVSGVCSPKSSTGRLDIFTRVLTDNATSFDKIAEGYSGKLYLEVSPKTFSIIARNGDTLTQLRLRSGETVFTDKELLEIDSETPLVYLKDKTAQKAQLSNGVWLSVDLEGKNDDGIIGYRARRHAPLLDLRKIGHYAVEDFWEPMYKPADGRVILNPEDFYILASREYLRVPEEYSAEMMAYETSAGELRVHYAGFFDPGFGCVEEGHQHGTTAVLEVRSHDVPFVLEHGQKICRMVYERLSEPPSKVYGVTIKSNYSTQTLKLAKQFK